VRHRRQPKDGRPHGRHRAQALVRPEIGRDLVELIGFDRATAPVQFVRIENLKR